MGISLKVNPFAHEYYESAELRNFGFMQVGINVKISKNCTIVGLKNISLGDHVRVDANTLLIANTGFLEIGSYVHIGANCYLGCAGGIAMENFSGISHGVMIFSCSDDYSGRALTNPTIPSHFLNVNLAPVRLKKHSVVGAGSVIMPGVVIGEGSAVGALSLVTRTLGDWGIYFGSPIKKIMARSRHLLIDEELLFKDCNKY